MPANRHRYSQAVPIFSWFMAIIIAVPIVGLCIKTLVVQQELRQTGERIKRLQKELTEISSKNEAFQTRKDQMTSTPELQKAIKDRVIKLVKIEEKFVVNVGAARRAVATNVTEPAAKGAR